MNEQTSFQHDTHILCKCHLISIWFFGRNHFLFDYEFQTVKLIDCCNNSSSSISIDNNIFKYKQAATADASDTMPHICIFKSVISFNLIYLPFKLNLYRVIVKSHFRSHFPIRWKMIFKPFMVIDENALRKKTMTL